MIKQVYWLLLAIGLYSGQPNNNNYLSTPQNLTCEYQITPFIDVEKPRLSWELEAKERGAMQKAWQVQVASSKENLLNGNVDIWDSGKQVSSKSTNVLYEGPSLTSSSQYFWRVKVWDEQDAATEFSEITHWQTALLSQAEWQARWIGDDRPVPEREEDFYKIIPNPIFRKALAVEKKIKKARLYISGLGYYEAFINGKKVGDRVLEPGWTNYGKRVLYSAYNVSDLLQMGENAIGVSLGNGWYNPLPFRLFRKFNLREYLTIGQPKFIAQLHLEFEDGSTETILSDTTWRSSTGPILKNNVYLGEWYDARQEKPGWNDTDFNDSDWQQAVLKEAPGGSLLAQQVPPIKITKRLKPVAIKQIAPNVQVVDFGQNFAGWIRLKLNGEAGTKVSLKYGELIYEDGSVNGMTAVAGQIKEAWNADGGPGSPKTAYQEDTYVLRGGGDEFFQQTFTFHGFRYVEIAGYTNEIKLDDIEGLRLNSAVEKAGTFSSSNTQFNQIQEITEWTMLSNIFSVQSDCPAREKFGYGGDIVTAAEAYTFNYHMPNFYEKAARDFRDDARPSGGMPETAPYNGIDSRGLGEDSGPVGWQLAYPYVQQLLWNFYGDKRILENHYPATKKMVDFMRSVAGENLLDDGIGDHESVEPKPVAFTSACFYYHNVKLLAQFAEILEKKEDAGQYQKVAEEIKEKINQKFMQGESGKYDTLSTQITQTFALYYGLSPEETEGNTLDVLLDEIMIKWNGHLATGIFGTKMLFDVLRKYEKEDVAFTVVNQDDFPGYGYMLANGATTLWEDWKKSDNVKSQNHPMFGSVSEWFYRHLGGINPDPAYPAFERLILKPGIPDSLDWVKTSYQSVKGLISSNWEKKEGKLIWEVSIPANVKADIYVPASKSQTVSEDKLPIEQSKGLLFKSQEEKYRVFEAGGGQYVFEVE